MFLNGALKKKKRKKLSKKGKVQQMLYEENTPYVVDL